MTDVLGDDTDGDRCPHCGAWPNETCSPHCEDYVEIDDEAFRPDAPGRW